MLLATDTFLWRSWFPAVYEEYQITPNQEFNYRYVGCSHDMNVMVVN